MSNDQASVTRTQQENSSQKLSPKIGIESHKRMPEPPIIGKLLFNLKITDLTRSDNPFVFYENQEVDKDGYLLFNCPEIQLDHKDSTDASKRRNVPKASLFKSYNNLQPVNQAKSSVTGHETEQDISALEHNSTHQEKPPGPTKNSLDAQIMLPWLSKPSDLEKRTLKIEVTFHGELILLRIIHIDKLYPVQYPMLACQVANNMIQNYLLREKHILVDDAPPSPQSRPGLQKVANKTFIHLD